MTRQEYLVKYRQDNKEKISAKAKIYGKSYREKNKDKIAAANKIFKTDNKQRASITDSIWRANNKEKNKKRQQVWSEDNRGLRNYGNSIIRAKELQRNVAWADLEKIKETYIDCATINIIAKMCGSTEKYCVDHDYPLVGENVSGLHVESNLVIMTEQENLDKNNSYEPPKIYSDTVPF